jgi:long-subunit acyl-CoA synthetase (AMP-forming)
VIKDKTGVFIGLVKLNEGENVDPAEAEQALNRANLVTFLCFILLP